MAISNLQETLLMYTKYKSMINYSLADIQMNILEATKQTTDQQAIYNEAQQQYYDYYEQEGMEEYHDEYVALMAELENEYEFRLDNIKSWEEQLMTDKLSYEARLAEIQANENSVRSLLKTNLKSDFTYGGSGQSS